MPRLTGGEAIARMLQLQGATTAFGIGGFQLLAYYDALARQNTIRHVLVRDEKHGGFAADGYARITNRPAIADATLGPGASNLVSAAAELQGAGIPGILLTGEVNSAISGRGATQESDQFHMLQPACKASVNVGRVDRIPELVRRAFALATAGKPGPVNLNVPEDVCHAVFDFDESQFFPNSQAGSAGAIRVRPDAELVDRAVHALRVAADPVVLVGGGIHLSQGYDALDRLVRLTGIPVASTISGKGALAETDPLALGIVGRYSRFANEIVQRADVLLVVGCKLGEIATNRWSLIGASTTIIHVDIDPTETQKVHAATTLWGDARLALEDLCVAIEASPTADRERAGRQLAQVTAVRRQWSDRMQAQFASDDVPIGMPRVRIQPARA